MANNARSALIGLYCRGVGQIGRTVGSHLNNNNITTIATTTTTTTTKFSKSIPIPLNFSQLPILRTWNYYMRCISITRFSWINSFLLRRLRKFVWFHLFTWEPTICFRIASLICLLHLRRGIRLDYKIYRILKQSPAVSSANMNSPIIK